MSLKLKAKSYKCRFLEAGVSNNNNISILIKADNLMMLAEKFKGVPVSVSHDDLTVDNVDNFKVGIVANVFKGDDGWAWCEFLVDEDEGERLLSQGYNISCAYTVLLKGAGGNHNGVDYDFEILDLQADHIAIVDIPHYTDAIVIKNSNNNKLKIKNMFKFMKSKNKENALKNSIEEKEEVFVKNGEDKIKISDLIDKYREVKNSESKSAEEEEAMILNEEDEVEVDGEMKTVAELLQNYNACMKNESKEGSKEEKEVEKEVVENSEDRSEKEDHYRDAEKDDASHISDLEEDMKDDAKAKDKLKNSKTVDSDFDIIKNAKKEFLKKSEEVEAPTSNFFEEDQERNALIQKIYGSSSSKK
jgi:hypothetical protein